MKSVQSSLPLVELGEDPLDDVGAWRRRGGALEIGKGPLSCSCFCSSSVIRMACLLFSPESEPNVRYLRSIGSPACRDTCRSSSSPYPIWDRYCSLPLLRLRHSSCGLIDRRWAVSSAVSTPGKSHSWFARLAFSTHSIVACDGSGCAIVS